MLQTTASALLCLMLASFSARAEEPVVLRMATVAPDGSVWAQELKSYSRAIEDRTKGGVRIKWYFNGVAGDELEQGERIRKGQLDGAASGHMLCERIAPSVRVARLAGVFQSRDEAFDVMNRLRPIFVKEGHQNGFAFLYAFGLGPVIIFSRQPVASLADLRKQRFWKWDIDEVGIATSRAMGVDIVSTPLYEATRAYEQGRADGFLTIPTAALAFQWSPLVRYFTELYESYLWGCIVVAERSFSRLSFQQQQVLMATTATMQERAESMTRKIDEDLMKRLFKRQGLTPVAVSDTFRTQFFAAARASRDKVAEKYIPKELLDHVLRLLADYRAEHPSESRDY
jgi:TRAP-type C4-dicarboxylate transport system substrate-binding protein